MVGYGKPRRQCTLPNNHVGTHLFLDEPAAPPPAPESPDEEIDWPAPKIVDTVKCVSLEKYNKLVAAAESAAHLQAEINELKERLAKYEAGVR